VIRAGNFFFRRRDLVSPAVFLALLAITRPVRPFGSESLDRTMDALGILLTASGQALRVAVIGYAYILRAGGGRGHVYAEDLVTRGLFGTCRNPLYLGNLLIYTGLIVVWNSLWMYLLAIPFYLFLYGSIVSAEETFLESKFGSAYREYCRDVPRWIPDFSRLRESLEGMSFNWRRVILKDYGTVAAWALSACLLLILEAVTFETGAARVREIQILIGVIALVTALWALALWLKVSKRLRGPPKQT